MRVFVFGDSITQGFWDSEGGWVSRLIKNYAQKALNDLDSDWVEIYNLGVSGDTIEGVINRINNEVKARQIYREDEVLIFAIGTNDTLLTKGEPYSSPAEFKTKLDELLPAAQSITKDIIFVGLHGVDDKLSNPWKYSSSGKGYTNERILEFEKVLRNFCQENKLPLVMSFEDISNKPEMFADGIHLNDKGHKLISERVKPELERLLGN